MCILIKYRLQYATKLEYDSGKSLYGWINHYDMYNVQSVEFDDKNLIIYISAYTDSFMEWMWRHPKTVIYKDKSILGMPYQVHTQKWLGWNTYNRKEYKDTYENV